jgi:hypothetical protein
MNGFPSLTLLSAALLTLGCAPLEDRQTEVTHSAILDGIETDLRPEVGLLATRDKSCTATMFSSAHFITAAHCISYAGLSAGGTLTLAGNDVPVDRIFSMGHNQLGTDDLAVGQLAGPLPSGITPAVIGRAAPSFDTVITQFGFGCTSRDDVNQGAGTKRFRTFTRAQAHNVGCPGDSGGPSFLSTAEDNGDLVLVWSGWNQNADFHADPGKHREEILFLADTFQNTGVCYRGHVANTGWLPPSCDGFPAGRPSDDVQALHLWTARPGVTICYQGFSAGVGWWAETCGGGVTGVTGQARPMQALRLRLATSNGERLIASANVAGLGWQPAVDVTDGGEIGIVGRGLREFTIELQ